MIFLLKFIIALAKYFSTTKLITCLGNVVILIVIVDENYFLLLTKTQTWLEWWCWISFSFENMFFLLFYVLLCFHKMKRNIDLIPLLDLSPFTPTKLLTVEWTFWWYWSSILMKFQIYCVQWISFVYPFHQIKVKSYFNLYYVFTKHKFVKSRICYKQ